MIIRFRKNIKNPKLKNQISLTNQLFKTVKNA